MLNAIIIDDNIRDVKLLQMMFDKYCCDEIRVTGFAQNIDSAYYLILENKPAVVFLDIELGGESGFDLLKKFTEYSFKVVFVTAYDKYAITAIKFNALDYVLKPIVIAELVAAVQKVKNAPGISVDAELKNLLNTLANPHQKSNKIAIPVLNGYKMVSVDTIQYCEANKEYTHIYCTNQPPVCSSVNLGEYEDLLKEYSFCRVHHSFLVNKDHVLQYIKGEGGELMIGKEKMIPVSRRKKKEVMEWLITNKLS